MATTVAQHPLTLFTAPTNGTSPIDADEVRDNDNAVRTAYNAHDADTGIHVQSSVAASRPAAGTSGRKWVSVDQLSAPTQVQFGYDDGTNWYALNYFPSAVTVAAGGIAVTGASSVAGITTITGAEGAYNFKVKGEATSTTVRIRSMPTATGAQIQATNNAEDTQVKLSLFALSHDMTASAGNITLTPTGGAVVVASGGIAVTGNSTITGTLGGLTGLTVASGGAAITGNSTITGTLGGLTGLTVASGGAAITGASTVSAGSTTNALIVTTTGAIQQSLRYDSSNRLDISVSSAGAVTFDAVGAGSAFTFSDAVTFSSAVTASSSLTVTGTLQANGNVALGNANTDTIEVQGVFINNLVPFVSVGYSLGTSTKVWSAAYVGTNYVGDDGIASDTYIRTSGVSTATTIASADTTTGTRYYIVTGKVSPGGADEFVDTVAIAEGGSPVAISSTTLQGSPATRTYTKSGNNLQLAMSANTYSVGARVFFLPMI